MSWSFLSNIMGAGSISASFSIKFSPWFTFPSPKCGREVCLLPLTSPQSCCVSFLPLPGMVMKCGLWLVYKCMGSAERAIPHSPFEPQFNFLGVWYVLDHFMNDIWMSCGVATWIRRKYTRVFHKNAFTKCQMNRPRARSLSKYVKPNYQSSTRIPFRKLLQIVLMVPITAQWWPYQSIAAVMLHRNVLP